MKRHHSIFGTKSIPNYRKQEFKNRRNRRKIKDTEYEVDFDEYESDDPFDDKISYASAEYLEAPRKSGGNEYYEEDVSLHSSEIDNFEENLSDDIDISDDLEEDLKEEAEKEGYKDLFGKTLLGNRNRENTRTKYSKACNNKKSRNRATILDVLVGRTSSRSLNKSTTGTSRKARKNRDNNIFLLFRNANTLEKISLVIGLAVVIISVALGGVIIRTKARANEISSFSNIGSEISEMQLPGNTGLVAVANAQAAKLAAKEAVSEASEEASSKEDTKVKVNLSLASIKQDLKIKFVNSESARLVSGIPFEVEVKKPDGSTTTWTDDDKDGIIYHYDISAGTYTVTMKALEGDAYENYTFNTSNQKIEVKENIEYKAVDVSDEVKTEAEVNVAAEDTAVAETVVESENTDTVEWVESTKTEIGSSGEISYEKIDKSTIVSPYSAKLTIDNDSIRLTDAVDSSSDVTTQDDESNEGNSSGSDNSGESTTSGEDNSKQEESISNSASIGTTTLNVGDTTNVSASSDSSSVTISYSSSNDSVAGVSTSGTVTANSAGTATITVSFSKGSPSQYTFDITVKEKEVAKTYSINPESGSVYVGESLNISATTNLSDTSVKWTSSNETIATVSKTSDTAAKVLGVAAGTATITATFSDGTTKTASIEVKSSTNIISNDTLSITVGATATLTASTSLSDKTYTWATSDKSIVTVSSTSGESITVTAVKAGTATITLTFADKTTKKCSVTVTSGNGKIELSASKASIIAGGNTLTLTAKVTGLTDTTVIWKSADESIATVTDGKVTGKKAGTVKITATSKADSSVSATCEVTVKDGTGELKDKSGNTVYVADNGSYRKATVADYDKADKFFIQKEGKLYKYTGWQTIEGYTYYYDKDGNYVTGDQVIQGAKYSFGSDGRLSTGSGTLGIDVSKWNGSIDWSQVKNSGVSYVIIRCGYRGSSTGALIEDPKFKSNIKGATAAGLKVGVYFFTQAVSDVEAVEEASMVISLIKGYNISCPVFLDVESSHGRADGISVSTRTAVCKAFCATIKNAGYTSGVYANKTWFNSYIDATALTGYKIWLAQYASSPTYTRTRYDMWQYSSSGSVSGISGRVDMNISYMGF